MSVLLEVPLMPEGDVFSTEELAAYLKLPESTVRQQVREGKIPGVKVGKAWRFHKAAIDRWLAGGCDCLDHPGPHRGRA
jgi:excisionase family DNA binding protein